MSNVRAATVKSAIHILGRQRGWIDPEGDPGARPRRCPRRQVHGREPKHCPEGKLAMSNLRLVTAALAAVLMLASCGAGTETETSVRPSPTPSDDLSERAEAVKSALATPPPEPDYHEPTAADFKLRVKTLDKECFGSAGCNVTFRVEVTYVPVLPLDPSKTYEVTYEITGGEEEMISTLEVTGDTASVPEDEFISTSSSKAQLKAKVTEVAEI